MITGDGAPLAAGLGLGSTRQRRPKVSEDVARAIAAFIIDENLSEGAMLPNETRMREMLNVGRTTLREALRLLETQGVLTIKAGPGGGPIVRAPRSDDLRGAMTLLLQFRRASFETLLEARALLEPPIASAAASRIKANHIAELAQHCEQMRAVPGDKANLIRHNEDFHLIIARATENIILEVVSATIVSIFSSERLGVTYGKNRQAAIARAHERILDALRQRDGAGAEEAMRIHLTEGLEYYRSRYPELMRQPVAWI